MNAGPLGKATRGKQGRAHAGNVVTKRCKMFLATSRQSTTSHLSREEDSEDFLSLGSVLGHGSYSCSNPTATVVVFSIVVVFDNIIIIMK